MPAKQGISGPHQLDPGNLLGITYLYFLDAFVLHDWVPSPAQNFL